MQIEYDVEADTLYVAVQPTKTVDQTRELEPGVMIDVDSRGRVIGLEILSFSKRYKTAKHPTAYLKNIRAATI